MNNNLLVQKYIDKEHEFILSLIDVHRNTSYIKKPKIVNIITNPDDKASELYTSSKKKQCENHGIDYIKIYATTKEEVEKEIDKANLDDSVTSIILQLPLNNSLKFFKDELIEKINKKKDIDRLKKCWYYDSYQKNLPVTAYGISKIIDEIILENFKDGQPNILLIGNGDTTNKNLFMFLFQNGYQVRIQNSKTNDENRKLDIEWSDIIVSSTGIPGKLKVAGRFVISPTIFKCPDTGKSMNDLHQDYAQYNHTHKVFGSIGKLTTALICLRAWTDL